MDHIKKLVAHRDLPLLDSIINHNCQLSPPPTLSTHSLSQLSWSPFHRIGYDYSRRSTQTSACAGYRRTPHNKFFTIDSSSPDYSFGKHARLEIYVLYFPYLHLLSFVLNFTSFWLDLGRTVGKVDIGVLSVFHFESSVWTFGRY